MQMMPKISWPQRVLSEASAGVWTRDVSVLTPSSLRGAPLRLLAERIHETYQLWCWRQLRTCAPATISVVLATLSAAHCERSILTPALMWLRSGALPFDAAWSGPGA